MYKLWMRIMRDAGAYLQGDVNIAGRDYSAGDRLPIMAGNAMMNDLIEKILQLWDLKLADPQS